MNEKILQPNIEKQEKQKEHCSVVEYDATSIKELKEKTELLDMAGKEALKKVIDIDRDSPPVFAHGTRLNLANEHNPSMAIEQLYTILKFGLVGEEFLSRLEKRDIWDRGVQCIKNNLSQGGYFGHLSNTKEMGIFFGIRDPKFIGTNAKDIDPNHYANLRINYIGSIFPQDLFSNIHVVIDPEKAKSLNKYRKVSNYGYLEYYCPRISSRFFNGLIIAAPRFSPLAKPFPQYISGDSELKMLAEEINEKAAVDTISVGILLGRFERKIREKHGSSNKELGFSFDSSLPFVERIEYKRPDNNVFVNETIKLFDNIQSEVFDDKVSRYIPLYSDQGDLLWPLKIPNQLIKEM